MDINYVAILVASVIQFCIGFVWYGFMFGKLWGQIHGFDKLSKEEQERAMKGMAPFYGLQFAVTVLTTFVLALFVASMSEEWHAFGIAGWLWLGFVLPTQISAVIFGGTEGKWILKKILVMSGAALACLMAAAAVLELL